MAEIKTGGDDAHARDTGARPMLGENLQIVVFASGGVVLSVAIRARSPDDAPCIVVDYDERNDEWSDVSPEEFERRTLGTDREAFDRVATYVW